jgi:hypothetical protein
MSTATVDSVVERFLKSANPEVLILKGAWGVGKTHAWRTLVERLKDELGLGQYCYVSLFGLNSIAELRLAIVAKTVKKSQIGKSLSFEGMRNNLGDSLSGLGRKLLAFGRDWSAAKGLALPLEALASLLIAETIICLDDFERIGSKLEPEEVLGFISILKEERSCKVVLIFNDQKLGDSAEKIYHKYREKVVDVELQYAPTPDEAVRIALKADAPWFNGVRDRAVGLNITNIRVLRTIDRVVGLLHREVANLHRTVLRQAIDTAVLMSWCYYEPDENTKPPVDFIREYNSFAQGFKRAEMKKKGEALDPKQEKWMKILDDYGWARVDELDLAILRVIEQGYIEESGLVEQARNQDAVLKGQDAEESFGKAWGKFHDTFANNQDELVEDLEASLKVSVKQVSPLNLNSTVRLLRDLKRDDVADRLLDYYMEQRGGEQKLFDLDSYAFQGEITDPRLRELFAAKDAVHNPLPTLQEAATVFAKGQGWDELDMKAMEAASAGEFYELFKKDHGDKLQRLVRGCLRVGGVAGHEEVGKRVRSALEKIAAESAINKLRVSRILGRRGED